MRAVHGTFDCLLELGGRAQRNIAFVSELTPDRSRWYEWIPIRIVRQIAYQTLKAIDMMVCVVRAKRPDCVFLFEHKPQYSLGLYAVCLVRRLPAFFVVHGIQQQRWRSPAHRLGFRILQWLVAHASFHPIHLEIADGVLPERDRFAHSIVIAHPLKPSLCAARRTADSKLRVGIVGMIREDKPVAEILRTAIDYCRRAPATELVVGTPFWQKPAWLDGAGVRLVDTAREGDYYDLLAQLDIVIADFERSSFFFRPSGVINDAIACGCFVICPDYPVFRHQVTTPATVGLTYESHGEIPDRLDEAVELLRIGGIEFEAWRAHRSNEAILEALARETRRYVPVRKRAGLAQLKRTRVG